MRAALLLLLVASPSLAAGTRVDYAYHGLSADVDLGLSIPAADSNYLKFADPALKIGMHLGWELALHKLFLLAPELNLDVIPVNTDESTFEANNVHFNASFTRVRFLVGARFALRFGKGEPFLRVGVGVDYIGGHVVPPIGNSRDFSSTAFVFKPAIGFQYEVVKYVVVGGELAMPVAGHDFGNVFPFFNTLSTPGRPGVAFTAFDLEIAAYAGIRY